MKCCVVFVRRAIAVCSIALAISVAGRAQYGAPKKKSSARIPPGAAASPRVSLDPKFRAGQTFRYEMEFETTTNTSRSGLASDPQGPTSLVVDWNATVRMEVLPADASAPGGVRLRTTYEKSAASVRSDTFDPGAADTEERFKKLEGNVVELTLDAAGKLKYVAGIEGMVDSEKASQSARDWVAQLSASAGAPPGGVSVGQKWISEQPADSLPLAGLFWRTESEYLRNEPCHPPNPDVPEAPGRANSAESLQASADCAVILANLSLASPKAVHDPTPPEFRKNGVRTEGKWSGSAQSLLYVSLASGLVVSVTQTGKEEMDVKFISNHNTSMRHAGTIASRSHAALLPDDSHVR
jgi:hypothetical protein